MGMPPASVLSMKLISHFKPKYIAMCGIAAGIKGKGNFGDILITEHSWDYNSGKLISTRDKTDHFECDPKVLTLSSHLKDKFATLKSDKKFLNEIEDKWPGNKPASRLDVHIGPVVSGSGVIQSSDFIDLLKAQNRKVIGLEMETYGVFFAANNCNEPKPHAFSIKSICDFADETKNDDYQAYAAFTSANYLYLFIKNEFSVLV
jgi:nucleoside phosphorylase